MSISVSNPYKYGEFVGAIPSCPPADGVPCAAAVLFRFVFSELTHGDNFRPPKMIKPGREFRDPADCCSAYALSLFHSDGEARTAYAKLKANNKKIGKTLGTHLASVAIEKGDGAITPKDAEGHSDLH